MWRPTGRQGLLLLAIAVTICVCLSVFVTTRPDVTEVVDASGARATAYTGRNIAKRARLRAAKKSQVITAPGRPSDPQRGTESDQWAHPGPEDAEDVPPSEADEDNSPSTADDNRDRGEPLSAQSGETSDDAKGNPRRQDEQRAFQNSGASTTAPSQIETARWFWRDERGRGFNALALHRDVCLHGADTIVPVVAGSQPRGPWAKEPAAPNEGTKLLTKTQRAAVDIDQLPQGTKWRRGRLHILARRPHGRNIAHAFVEALWLLLHVLRHVAEGTLSDRLPAVSGSDAASRPPVIVHTPHEDYSRGLADAVNRSTWQAGVTAAAALAAGMGDGDLLPNPTAEGPKDTPPTAQYECFEWLLTVGTSRDMCVGAVCGKDGDTHRDATKRFINGLAVRYAGAKSAASVDDGGAPKLRVGLYLREDQNLTKFNRRILAGREFTGCLAEGMMMQHESNDGDGSTPVPSDEAVAAIASELAAYDVSSVRRSVALHAPQDSKRSSTDAPVTAEIEFVRVPSVPRFWGAQARLWASFDVLVGANGAGNTNALWMPPSSGVVVLSACSQGYLSWMGTTRLPDQDVVMYKLCTKKSQGVTFQKPPTGGLLVPCSTMMRLRGGRLRMLLPDVVEMLLWRRADALLRPSLGPQA